jgi:DNA-binding Lrp family transcriptional regulator
VHGELDDIDRKILDALQKDGDLSIADLAERVCLSPSPCSRRVRILHEKGYFSGRVNLVDATQVGLSLSVFVQVKLVRPVKASLVEFESIVRKWPEVMECYLMTGDFDYLLRVVMPDHLAYQAFLDEKLTGVESIHSINSSFSLKQVQYKTALPLAHLGRAGTRDSR